MPRPIHADMLAHLRQKQTYLINLVHLDFRNDPVYIHTDIGTINWDGHDWVGIGLLGAIDSIKEDDSLEPDSKTLSMRIFRNDVVDLRRAASVSEHLLRDAKIWLTARDAITGEILNDPLVLFDGEMHGIEFDVGVEKGTASLTLVDDRVLDNRSLAQNLSDAHQQKRYQDWKKEQVTGGTLTQDESDELGEDLIFKHMAAAAIFDERWGPEGPDANKNHTSGGGKDPASSVSPRAS